MRTNLTEMTKVNYLNVTEYIYVIYFSQDNETLISESENDSKKKWVNFFLILIYIIIYNSINILQKKTLVGLVNRSSNNKLQISKTESFNKEEIQRIKVSIFYIIDEQHY